MTKEAALFLKEASENAGNECDIRENYSGRGMYGRTTCGVVVASLATLLADVIQYVGENIHDIDEDGEGTAGHTEYVGKEIPDMSDLSVDNMAMDVIVY